MTPTGHTRDAGWEIGVSRTVGLPIDEVWEFLLSAPGTAIWLGSGVSFTDSTPARTEYETDGGVTGQTRSVRPQDRIRLTWRPTDWDHDSTVQVAVSASGADRTMLRFHQERLADAAERERQREHWTSVLSSVIEALPAGSS